MRQFDSGATRDEGVGKIDPEGYLSPLVIQRYCEYMLTHQQTSAGFRASDNWQMGIPLSEYMKSLWRHTLALWRAHRLWPEKASSQDSLCAILFNASGMLHELLKKELQQ